MCVNCEIENQSLSACLSNTLGNWPVSLDSFSLACCLRCVPIADTTVSAVALPNVEAMLDTPTPGFWLIDFDSWDVLPPTAGSGVSKAPVAVPCIVI